MPFFLCLTVCKNGKRLSDCYSQEVHNMYDVIGAGIGPFNLGIAALLEDIPGTDALFSIKRKNLRGIRAC